MTNPISDLPVIFDQRSPTGIRYRGPTRLVGWELLEVFRGYPTQDSSLKDEAGLEAVRKELMRISREGVRD